MVSQKVRCSSKMKPRFRAEWEVSNEELCILASWFLSPMSKNLVITSETRSIAVSCTLLFSISAFMC